MSFARYTLPDGTEAGYAVTSACDRPGCDEIIFRGMDALCGDMPATTPTADKDTLAGCGGWYCEAHLEDHKCVRPACGLYDAAGEVGSCRLVAGHEGAHSDGEFEFTEVEEA